MTILQYAPVMIHSQQWMNTRLWRVTNTDLITELGTRIYFFSSTILTTYTSFFSSSQINDHFHVAQPKYILVIRGLF